MSQFQFEIRSRMSRGPMDLVMRAGHTPWATLDELCEYLTENEEMLREHNCHIQIDIEDVSLTIEYHKMIDFSTTAWTPKLEIISQLSEMVKKGHSADLILRHII